MTDKTQTKAVSNAPLTDEEFAEKYNSCLLYTSDAADD